MKRILTFLCAITFVFLCGCDAGEITPVTENVGFTAHISYYNENYVTEVEIDENGVFTMLITEPDVLKDISFVFSPEQVKAIYNGIEYQPNENNTQFFGVAENIYAVFQSIKGVTAIEDDGIYVIKGEADDGEFKIEFGKTGLPLSMQMDNNISVRFSDAKIINHAERELRLGI